MSNEESEQDVPCSRCGKKSEQSLVLSCDHNLCMNCAAENLVRNEVQGINLMPFVVCDICQTKTNIDVGTSKEILSLGLNNNNNNMNYQNVNLEKNYNVNENILNFDAFSTSSNIINANNNNLSPVNAGNLNNKTVNINNKNKSIFEDSDIFSIKSNNNNETCKEHGEPISYLCLDCMINCICPECIIHGTHKNHEVLNIKKAYPLIYKKIQEIGSNINSKVKELYSAQNGIEQKRKDISMLNQKCKIDVKQAFNEIRSLLDKKEKEIIKNIENTLNDNLNELNNCNNLIQKRLVSMSKLTETINSYLMKKKEINLINFYTENKNKILSQLDLNDINKLNIDIISNLKVDIDKSSFDSMLSAINSFNFKIEVRKGGDKNIIQDLDINSNRNNSLYDNNILNDISENQNNLISKINNI